MSSIPLGGVVRQLHRLAGVPLPEISDGQLLERFCRAGEAAAFEALVQRHGPMVLGVCRRVLRDGHAAEDAFQATFLVLLRRATALDRQRSLGNWLYTVAYHVALRARADSARRRRTEGVAHMPGQKEPQSDLLWRELQPVLDEELGRLPEHYRTAVVLCYLEGRTNEEAGRLLGWPVGTVKSRLARARQLLRTRLARRGVTLSAGLLAGALETAVAAMPALLARRTVTVALGAAQAGFPPLRGPTLAAITLAEGASNSMYFARLKMVAALLLLAGVVALGVGAFAGQAEAQRRAPAPSPVEPAGIKPAARKDPPSAVAKPGAAKEAVTLTGRVFGGDGRPLPGARVLVVGGAAGGQDRVPRVLAEARTDRAGRFRLAVRRPSGNEAVLAQAPRHGSAWQYPLPERGKGLDLYLPPEQVLRGRLIDLQGQPAPGVNLQVVRLGPRETSQGWIAFRPGDGEKEGTWRQGGAQELVRIMLADDLLAKKKKLERPKEPPPPLPPTVIFQAPPKHLPGWPGAVTTDAQGRFVLRGVGKGQGVGLRTGDERFGLQVLDFPPRDGDREVTRVLAPARILEGRITDADTGKPLPHATVHVSLPGSARDGVGSPRPDSLASCDPRGRRGMWGGIYLVSYVRLLSWEAEGYELPPLEVRTDSQGRFRFRLFRADSYRLRVNGPAGAPYLSRGVAVSWPGEAVVRKQLDLTLQRGAVVRGRVTEAPGGKPVAGARLDLWCKGLKHPEGTRHPWQLTAGKDGQFEALLPPGRWHLLVNGTEPCNRTHKVAIDQLTEEQPTSPSPDEGQPGPRTHFYPDAWTAMDLKPGAEREVAVALRRAPLLRGRVVGPDGQPVAGVYLIRRPVVPVEPTFYPKTTAQRIGFDVQRPWEMELSLRLVVGSWRPPRAEVMPVELRDGTFSIAVLDPDATYRLYFLSPSGQLGAMVELSGKQAEGDPVTVRLRPCARATARLVDGRGKPLAGQRPLVWLLVPPGPHAVPADLKGHLEHNLRTADAVWAAYLNPGVYGDGPRTDGEGRVTFPGLVPGARYRVLLGPGRARDFTADAARAAELGDLTIDPPVLTERLPVVRPGK
jgi:RNA polymerase sigma factor (sigma-70 family)